MAIAAAFIEVMPIAGTETEHRVFPDPGQVVGIDREIGASKIAASLPSMEDEWAMKKRHEWFGHPRGERAQACAEASTE
jgi:hypothetical protein